MKIPLVSVVVATYRRDGVLVRALESLAIQTYLQYEIILVDDNDSPEWNHRVAGIVEAFRQDHPSVPVTVMENHPGLGSARARNIGIGAARGEYITFLDDDDLYLPEKLKRQVTAMLEAGADYCITDLALYTENERLAEYRARGDIPSAEPCQLLQYHLMHHLTGTDTLMFRAEYLRKIGGFPPVDVGDEFYLMKEAVVGGGRFLYLPGCDAKAYLHSSGGLSSGAGKIEGENELYRYKRQFFSGIDGKGRRYIRMRHHAVLAYACFLRRGYVGMAFHGVCAVFCAPLACMRLVVGRIL